MFESGEKKTRKRLSGRLPDSLFGCLRRYFGPINWGRRGISRKALGAKANAFGNKLRQTKRMEECAELTAQEQRTKGRPTADSDGADGELALGGGGTKHGLS